MRPISLAIARRDWWIMQTDGSDKRRLTFMNVRNHVQSVNRFRLAGTVSFISNTSFFAM